MGRRGTDGVEPGSGQPDGLPYGLEADEDTDERERNNGHGHGGLGFDPDPDVDDLNSPDVEELGEPPLVGRSPVPTDMFGNQADVMGRPSSPRLLVSSAAFPAATQLRVWKIENGVPVGIGPIDAGASEEDFVRVFFDAMPKRGEGRGTYKMRPVDIRGQELGKEFTLVISEHHASLAGLRRQKEMEMNPMNPGPYGSPVNFGFGQPDPAASAMAEQMGQMFEHSVEMAEAQTHNYQAQLEAERERLRVLETQRVEERVRTAERATGAVEKMTERLLASDKSRSDEALASQKHQSDFTVHTITAVFAQQQSAAQAAAERQRELDAAKAATDREFFERQRQEAESRRQRELADAEIHRKQERDDAEQRRQADKADWERKQTEVKTEAERKERESKAETERRIEQERRELEFRREQLKEERERWRVELEERRRSEQLEWEKKQAAEKEDRDRRERAERDRFERERLDMTTRSDRERAEWERRETIRREEYERTESRRREDAAASEARRREELQLQLKQMEQSAIRDKEHAERMMTMASHEREAQREAALQREKMEREAREQAERDRQRQHDLQMKEMELARERDREHGERMLQLTKDKNLGGLGGLSALTGVLGMEPVDILSRVFGGGGEDGNNVNWAEAIPKVLSAVADLGKVAVAAKTGAALEDKQPKRRMIPQQQQTVVVNTPDGPRSTTVAEILRQQAQAQQAQRRAQDPTVVQAPDGLPAEPYIPDPQPVVEPAPAASPPPVKGTENRKLEAGRKANTLRRGRAAGISVADQRKARRATMALAERLSKAEEAQWVGIVAEELTRNPGIFHYLKAVSVYAALAETGASGELAERIVAAIRSSSMVPEGVLPYDEDDFVKMQMAEAAQVVKDVSTVEAEVEVDK